MNAHGSSARRGPRASVLATLLASALASHCTSAPPPVSDAPDAAPPDAPAGDAPTDAAPDAPDAELAPPEVVTRSGTVRGRRGFGYREFLGIPYAAPPVGPLRWRPPQPPAAWTAPREATTQPPRCPQNPLGLGAMGNEDCLYLNVHTPDPPRTGAPVMVWIHGGAFVLGEGLQLDGGTRGDVLARERGVIVVSLNYRLGALGFLAHPALTAERAERSSGNYGLLDQLAALQWVRANIAAFGGDPEAVTLFGESAGGMSVCAQLAMPAAAGTFQRAIIQSGPCGRPSPTLADGEAQGRRLATALGCETTADPLACMRAATPAQVLAALPTAPSLVSPDPMYGRWLPVVDGHVIPEEPMRLYAAGRFNRVPTIAGWNRDEGTLFVHLAMQAGLTAAEYPAAVAFVVGGAGPTADRVLAQYPLSRYPNPAAALSAVIGDYVLACPSRRAFRAMAPHLPSARSYYFTYPNAQFQLEATLPLGAFHSADIQYVFGHPARLGRPTFAGADLALHRAMMGYWTRFATTGDPNGEGAPVWPAYDVAGDAHLVLDAMPSSGAGASATECAFWESLGVY